MTSASVTPRSRSPRVGALSRGVSAAPAAALGAIVILGASLRFQTLSAMSLNPFYDAAVRSMGSSWHGFLLAAFNPNVSVATDKPPVDLWLQVASTKLLGFTPFALHLPEALAGTAAIVLLYDLVRRGFGRTAGLASAAALAVLPTDVVTARSDTMDGAMMTLLVLAAWLVVRALEKGRLRELYLAGAVVGLAFETKLFEALVPLPALALLFFVGSRAPAARRAAQLAIAGGLMAAVGLAWPLVFALTPAASRPYPLGSTNGSIWNTVFTYNGLGRVAGTSVHTSFDNLTPAGPTRLLTHGPLHLDAIAGMTLVAAVLFAIVALVPALARTRRAGQLQLALVVALGTWLVCGVAVLSYMQHLTPRYLEAVTPAIAAALGIGLSYAARYAVRGARVRGLGPLAVLAATGFTLLYAAGVRALPPVAILAALGAAIALAYAWISAVRGAPAGPAGPLGTLVATLALVAVLAAPTAETAALVRSRASDGGAPGAMPRARVAALSNYLARNRGQARYEFAALRALDAGALIAADGQPVLILSGTQRHALLTADGLSAAVVRGLVRYVLLSDHGSSRPIPPGARGGGPLQQIIAWVTGHGVDVSRRAGLHAYGVLYRVSV